MQSATTFMQSGSELKKIKAIVMDWLTLKQKGGRENMHKKSNPYIDQAKHCIGLDRKKPYIRHGKKFYRPYRNYFATGRNYEVWEAMEFAGYAKRGNRTSMEDIHSI